MSVMLTKRHVTPNGSSGTHDNQPTHSFIVTQSARVLLHVAPFKDTCNPHNFNHLISDWGAKINILRRRFLLKAVFLMIWFFVFKIWLKLTYFSIENIFFLRPYFYKNFFSYKWFLAVQFLATVLPWNLYLCDKCSNVEDEMFKKIYLFWKKEM